MTHRTKERLGGLFILACGLGLTAFNWHLAFSRGYYYVKSSMLGPAFACLGLGLVVFPSHREERAARGEDPLKLQGYRLITPRWWIILGIGICVGLLNVYLIAHRAG